jgi:hypothetical protein
LFSKTTGSFFLFMILGAITDRCSRAFPGRSDSLIGEFGIAHLDSFFSEFVSIDEIIIDNGCRGFRVGLFDPGKDR